MKTRILATLVLASTLMTGGDCMAQTSRERTIALPGPNLEKGMALHQALARRNSVRDYAEGALSLEDMAQVLWAAQGAKGRGDGLTVPSAGALYPLEVYLVVGSVSGLGPGVYHYEPSQHALTPVSAKDCRKELAAAALGQACIRKAPAVVTVAAVIERTARKYRGRAPRYVHMEVGAVMQDVYLEATALGLGTVMVGAFEDDAVRSVLGLPADHDPLALMPIGKKK